MGLRLTFELEGTRKIENYAQNDPKSNLIETQKLQGAFCSVSEQPLVPTN